MKKTIGLVLLVYLSFASLAFALESSVNSDSAKAPILVAERRTVRSTRGRSTAAGPEKPVDLTAMDSAPPAKPSETASTKATVEVPGPPHHGAGVDPHFSVYFDLLMAYQPGKAGFSFLNFHPLLLMEVIPTPELIFSFEVNPTPRYFELDYQATRWLTLRGGKIWIPFDDISPHSLFGGMITNSRQRLGTVAYLPDIWADLGVGAKFLLYEGPKASVDANLYVVNGFGAQNSPDPLGVSPNYPTFSDIPVTSSDNNNAKSIGGRLHILMNRRYSFGFSFYSGRWSNEGDPSATINMLGVDTQLDFGKVAFRAGISYMPVSLLNNNSYARQGEYAELVRKFGTKNEWSALGRIGYLDVDDRLTDDNDLLTVGGGIRYRPGILSFQVEHYQDLKKVDIKKGYSFTFFRTIVQL